MLTLSRPVQILSNEHLLDAEYRAARWVYHRLLDFEDQHQRVLDAAAEAAAPGIVRVGRILARLARRARRRERTTSGQWSPDPKPELAAHLKALLPGLRAQRDADPKWQEALRWADTEVGEPITPRRRRAVDPSRVRRRKSESDEAFQARLALLTADESEEHFAAKSGRCRTRREQYRVELYAQIRCYAGAWDAMVCAVDQARRAVLARRKRGMPAEWRRPKWRDPITISYRGAHLRSGFRVIERGPVWWTIAVRVGREKEWVRLRAKCGNWHALPEGAEIKSVKLTRRQDGARWAYSLSLAVEGVEKPTDQWATRGRVAFDWGHREHGHDTASAGLRAFVWRGDDSAEGEVLVPAECRQALDEIDTLKGQLDETFNARKAARGLPDRNRHAYRRRLERAGVRTAEESDWLRWEMRYERRIAKRRKRSQNLRCETYIQAVRALRKRYAEFVFEGESNASIKRQQTDEQMERRKRANRDLSARYEFVLLCERFGARLITVPARNTTRECPTCGHVGENGPELLAACPACGTVRDKDRGAAVVILRRAEAVLANHVAE